jgi:hypothetical protein
MLLFRCTLDGKYLETSKQQIISPAQKIADAYEAAARIRRTKSHTMRVIDRLHEEIGGQPIQRETLQSFSNAQLWANLAIRRIARQLTKVKRIIT